MQVRQRTGGITTVTQKQTGDFVQLCAHFIRHVSRGGQFKGLRQQAGIHRLTGSVSAHGRKRHLLGEHVRRGAAVFTRHGQTVLQGITGNLQRTGNIAGIQTPQHDRHQNVILCTFALLQHAVHPRQPERQQFAFFRGLQLF